MRALDVLLFFDDFTEPPKPKLITCVEPALGYFFRINSRPWPIPVRIDVSDHSFLDHDSFIECGSPLELSDYIVDESLERHGILGSVQRKHIPEIVAALTRSAKINGEDRRRIVAALTSL